MRAVLRRLVVLVLVLVSSAAAAGSHPAVAGIARTMPAWEVVVLERVAAEYRLDARRRQLLFAVRKVENGRPGVEMGIEYPAARRFAGQPARSLELQARYAAGTLQKRWRGDLGALSRRWCPERPAHWRRLMGHWLARAEVQTVAAGGGRNGKGTGNVKGYVYR